MYHRSGQVFVVANYDPPGNFIGSFTENVPPIGGFVTTPKIVINDVPDFEDSTHSHNLTNSSLDLDNFVNAMLRYHNEFRRRHSVPDLKYFILNSQEFVLIDNILVFLSLGRVAHCDTLLKIGPKHWLVKIDLPIGQTPATVKTYIVCGRRIAMQRRTRKMSVDRGMMR